MENNNNLVAHAASSGPHNGCFAVLLILLCIATYALYYPGIFGPFLLDDSPNLQTLTAGGGVTDFKSLLNFVFSNESGRLGRPVAMLSFLIDDQHWPSYAPSFKHTNVMIHLMIGVMVFVLSRQLLRQITGTDERNTRLIALFVAAYWLLHPLNVSTTLYVVQRMTQLSTLFSLVAMILYLHGRRQLVNSDAKGCWLIALAFFPFGVAGILSKENAVLFVPLLLLIELLSGRDQQSGQFRKYRWLITGTLLVFPSVLLIGYFVINWESVISGYSGREFTIGERLLTETRVLCDYLYKIFIPRASGLGLFHDDFVISRSLFAPLSTLAAVVFLCGMLLLSILVRKKYPILLLAMGWFMIAHLLESTSIPLEIYFEHRNYLAMLGPILLLGFVLVRTLDRIFTETPPLKYFVLSLILLVQAMMLNISTRTWGDTGLLFYSWAVEHPTSLRAQRNYSAYLERAGLPDHAIKVLDEAYKVHPYDVSLLLAKLNIQCDQQLDEMLGVDEIIDASGGARFTDGVLFHIEKLTDKVIAGQCSNYNEDKLHRLFDYLENLPLLAEKWRYAARLYYLHANLYIHQRNLSGAMAKLEQVYQFQPTVDVALKQAVLLGSAGLYEQALERVQAARTADQNRRFMRPSRREELVQFERYIRRQQQSALDSGL